MAEENIGGNRCLRSMVDDGHCCRHRDIRSPGFNSWKLGRLMEWRFIDRFTFCVRLIPIVKGNVREYLTIFNITILISY